MIGQASGTSKRRLTPMGPILRRPCDCSQPARLPLAVWRGSGYYGRSSKRGTAALGGTTAGLANVWPLRADPGWWPNSSGKSPPSLRSNVIPRNFHGLVRLLENGKMPAAGGFGVYRVRGLVSHDRQLETVSRMTGAPERYLAALMLDCVFEIWIAFQFTPDGFAHDEASCLDCRAR